MGGRGMDPDIYIYITRQPAGRTGTHVMQKYVTAEAGTHRVLLGSTWAGTSALCASVV